MNIRQKGLVNNLMVFCLLDKPKLQIKTGISQVKRYVVKFLRRDKWVLFIRQAVEDR